ncbi:MAG: hypothetical protein H6738_25625, partial [Alphaproteobacteria bacterium]|nr:hypothetical protein [Alphaproteobacteria bacterium]
MVMLSLLLGGCTTHAPPASPLPTVSAAPTPGVEVEVDYAADEWTVTWTFAEPVAGVWFPRSRHAFRQESWALRTEGWSWVSAPYGEVLVAEEPSRSVSVRFPTDTRNRTKDYKLNLAFSEDSRLLFTGHLLVHPMRAVPEGVERAADGVEHRWTVKAEGRVQVLDHAGTDTLTWSDPQLDDEGGTYVYIGTIEPLRTDDLTAIVDPGMPTWMREETLTRLPELIALYTERTGHPLSFRPLVLASFDPTGSGTDLKGGTLPGLVQLHAGGTGWSETSSDVEERWFWFLGHETFHLWNGQEFRKQPGRWEEWASEGLSDLYAL